MPAFPPLTVFDVETTGLDPLRGHKIVELAAVRVEDGKINKEGPFNTFVNPERTIPPEAAQVNRIRNEDLEGAPSIDQVIPLFLDFAKDTLLVAHNAAFDMGFINSEKEHCWGFVEIPECLCTMCLSRSLFPGEFRHSLDVVSMRLGIELPPKRHRALPDVMLTAEALLKMLEIGKITSVADLKKKASWGQLVR